MISFSFKLVSDQILDRLGRGRRRVAANGICARRPLAEIVNKLNKEVNAALDDPKMKARLADFGGTPLPGSPAQFGKLIVDETEKWGQVIKFAGIKPQ